MALILIAFNVITGAFRVRVDLTADKAYTLSDGTRAILHKLDTPVKIRFYCTKAEIATPETVYLRDYARRVEDLLAAIQQIAGNKLTIEKFDPQPDSDAEDSARLDGIEGQQLPNGEKYYLGPGRERAGPEGDHSVSGSRAASVCWNMTCRAPFRGWRIRTGRWWAS